MAGDWVKMRTDLYRDPKVCVMADFLMDADGELARFVNQNRLCDMTVTRNVMRNVTVGALVSVWGVFRLRGKRSGDDLRVSGATLAVIDDVADVPGFGDAMASVGWAVQDDDGVVFPRFFEDYNVDPSIDSKQKNADRQRRFRDRRNDARNVTDNVTVTLQSNAREEKSREEKEEEKDPPNPPSNGGNTGGEKPEPPREKKPKQNPAAVPIPAEIDTPEFRKTWADWIADRAARGKKFELTDRAAELQLRKLAKVGAARAIEVVEQSIERTWQGLVFDVATPAPKARPAPAPPVVDAAKLANDIGEEAHRQWKAQQAARQRPTPGSSTTSARPPGGTPFAPSSTPTAD